jgi:hypothetical protein
MTPKQDTPKSDLAGRPTSDESSPSVPGGGFKFGPSRPPQSKPVESTETAAASTEPLPLQTKVSAGTTSATLRPEATGFLPATKADPPSVSVPAVEAKNFPPPRLSSLHPLPRLLEEKLKSRRLHPMSLSRPRPFPRLLKAMSKPRGLHRLSLSSLHPLLRLLEEMLKRRCLVKKRKWKRSESLPRHKRASVKW